MNYQTNAKKLSKYNLADCGFYYVYDWYQFDAETQKLLSANDYVIDERVGTQLTVWKPDSDAFNLTEEPLDVKYQEEMAYYYLRQVLKKADHYLVFVTKSRWDGAAGYRFADNILQTVQRNDTATICPINASRQGKILECVESSHDVPMGALTYIVALTERECSKLSNSPFDVVEEFVQKLIPRCEIIGGEVA